ncbi:probable ATP-dependent DNA helicase HFM1 [Contarinia nasturtii]|uniref:probable ATP-dependent DNA helicase HFM1 n=1 Tax=Contarinia nasturtii TaxID=265458 RepID=UPI0012D41970|nr:probable ATP-dependent DNA helicase HFM1 [Contarinia nasturtii]
MTSLRSLSDIPQKFRSVFAPIEEFNIVQSKVFDDVFKKKHHIVVSSPTGSGKTVIFELAIVEMLMRLGLVEVNKLKIIYIAPTKALCNEIFLKWTKKFKTLNLKVVLVTGDTTDMDDLNVISPFHVIVTTPEKWDSLTRKWKEHCEITNAVRLVLIDEVHLVGDKNRGQTLEAIVSRFKTFPNGKTIRFVAVSASLPNIQDFAQWIGAQSFETVRTFKLDDTKPSVEIVRKVCGYVPYGNSFQFQKQLNPQLVGILQEVLEKTGKQILVFCSTRYDVELTLTDLMNSIELSVDEIQHHGSKTIYVKDELKALHQRIKDDKLRTCVHRGFAYHHGGLTFDDREEIEDAYKKGLIKILVCSQTLACGVNLPAHAVIIKSTEMYIDGRNQEMPESMVLQMLGRAGRQEYNKSGLVYILTKKDKVKYYENLSVGTVQIESHMHVDTKLAEFLNAEIALKTITNEKSIIEWLRMTFLYARTKAKEINVAELKELYIKAVKKLRTSNLIEEKSDGGLLSRPFGTVMAKYFLSISTMDTFQKFKGNETIEKILDKIVGCNEFSEHYTRSNEVSNLNKISQFNRYQVIPNRKPPYKVSCLLQAVLGQSQINTTSLIVDAQKILQTAERVVQSTIEFFNCSQYTNDCFKAILSSTLLAKSLRMRTWNDRNIFGQLGISETAAKQLNEHEIYTIEELTGTQPREIEDILEKVIPYGTELIQEASKKFPRYKVNVMKSAEHVFHICITQTNTQYVVDSTASGLTLLVGDFNNQLICYDDIQLENGVFEKLLHFTPGARFLYVFVIHHSLAGADQMITYDCVEQTTSSDNRSAETKRLLNYIWEDSSKRSLKQGNTNPSKFDSNGSVAVSKSNQKQNAAKLTHNNNLPFSKMSKNTNPQQSTISQHFRTVKQPTLFSKTASSTEKPKQIRLSPDIFSTPIEATQKPFYLYDYSQSCESNRNQIDHERLKSLPPLNGDEPNNTKGHQANGHSQQIVETPIQNKIREERGGSDSFVTAKVICKKDLNEKEDELDVLMFWDKMDSDEEEHQKESHGLEITTNTRDTGDTLNSVQKILNSTSSICHRDIIYSDFDDDCDDWNSSFLSLDEANMEFNAYKDEFLKVDHESPKRLNLQNLEDKVATSSPQLLPGHQINQTQSTESHAATSSFDTNAATCGSFKRKVPLSEKSPISAFQYQPPRKMLKTYSQQKENINEPITNKKSSLVDELMKNGAKNALESNSKMKNLRAAELNCNMFEPQRVDKVSLRSVLRIVRDKPNNTELDINNTIEQYQKRLLTDPNYKQADYDKDVILLKVLKMTPKTEPERDVKDKLMVDDDLTHCSFTDNFFNFATPDH